MPEKRDYESGKPYLDLPDYKGPFRPGLRYEDFTKERLAKLYNAAGKMFLTMDAVWERHVRENYGEEAAVKGHIDIWHNKMSYPEWAIMYDALGIMGETDLEAIMKHNQFDPGWPYPLFEARFEMQDKDHGICTVFKCSAVDYAERHGKEDGLHDICYKMEPGAFENYTMLVNPQITSRALKRPPRKNKNDVACIWEYTYVKNARKEWPKSDWKERWKDWKDEDIK